MGKEYKEHIVSTPEHQVWLHRTHTSNISGILKNGLGFGAGDLTSTATLQPFNLEEAENKYRQTHKGNNAVVVIKIPQTIASIYYLHSKDLKGLRHNGYESDKEVTYFERGFYIQRKHVHGWIDRETDEYHTNPHLDGPQNLTDKHFPSDFYGGLEKGLIEQEKFQTRTKKTRKIKKGKLPPPPKFIIIA